MTKTHEFHLTGAARKPLIEAIENFANVKGVYQGAPKFGYAFYGIGVLDKEGALHFDCDMQVIMDCVTWLEQCGFACDNAMQESTGGASGEPVAEGDTLAIEMPLEGFNEESFANLEKLIASKAGLIKKALGVENLLVETSEHRLRFPWFKVGLEQEKFTAYAWFISALCGAAKEQKRVTAKEKPVDNEKFAFRVFLIRLGFVGDEYKAARKILLRNLSGNSAFKNGAPTKANESGDSSDE